MRFPVWMQALLVIVLAVVLGGILVAVIGMMIAVNNRQYPTRKRTFTKDSRSRW